MVGPSASGSEYGTPSSTRSAPQPAYASATAIDVSRSGYPAIMYGINAARPSALAAWKAAEIRSTPEDPASLGPRGSFDGASPLLLRRMTPWVPPSPLLLWRVTP